MLRTVALVAVLALWPLFAVGDDVSNHADCYQPPLGSPAYPVTEVVDGDTIKIEYNGNQETVRLIGVDAPETVDPRKPVQDFGVEASNFAKNLLEGESVYLRLQTNRDKYGRLLAYVYRYPDGLFVNLEIIRQGYGFAYLTYPFEYADDFRYFEARARDTGKGLWGEPTDSSPDTSIPETFVPNATADTNSVDRSKDSSTQPQSFISNPESENADDSITVYITDTGEKYHRGDCSSLRKSKHAISLAEAKREGYTPCKRCNPPE